MKLRKSILLFTLLLMAALLASCDLGMITSTWPSSSPAVAGEGSLQVHYIDVGQGDSILILAPDGSAALIDGGEARSGALQYMKDLGVRRLEWIVVTHPHDDHIGGLPEILHAIPTAKVITNGQPHTTSVYERLLDAIVETRAEYVEVGSGESLTLGNLTFEVMNPTGTLVNDMNENSVVLRLVYGKVSFLFMGDAEKGAEANMMSLRRPLKSTVLKLGHHASRTSTSAEFLKQVSPDLAIYTAAEGNKYGHPHQETLDALDAADVDVYGTDQFGSIVIVTDGSVYQVSGGTPRSASQSETATPQPHFLDIVSVTSPAAPGSTATVTARTLPGANCTITVYTKSGASQAQGLEGRKADDYGNVSWTWRVGSSTSEGVFRIEVTASQRGETISKETTYQVKK